jgi:hypothetical protein
MVVSQEKDSLVVLEHAQDELETVEKLMDLVDESVQYLSSRNLSNVIINPGNTRIVDNKSDRIAVLRELKATAYGKTVVLQDGEVVKIYRIAQANDGFAKIGVLHRLTPVARILVSAEVGDDVKIPSGTYEVIAVANLTRYDGVELSINWANFKRMKLQRDDLSIPQTVEDLRQYVKRGEPQKPTVDSEHTEGAFDLGEIEGLGTESADWVEDEFAEDEEPSGPEGISQEERMSLSGSFYTSTTRAQEELMQEGMGGLLLVEGVAGSGKTSVALGRAKVFFDRRYNDPEGEEHDDFFNQETAVGFVLSSQLIDYLKLTRDQLYMHQMPVKEFHELRESLRRSRNVDGDGKYSHYIGPDPVGDVVGQMPWLYAADRAIASRFADRLAESFREEIPKWQIELEPSRQEILGQMWLDMAVRLRGVIDSLRQSATPFALEGLAKQVQLVRNQSTDDFGQGNFWVKDPVTDVWKLFKSLARALDYLVGSGSEFGYSSKDKIEKLLDLESQLDLVVKRADKLMVDGKVGGGLLSRDELRNRLINELIFYPNDGRWQKIACHQKRMAELLRRGELWTKPAGEPVWQKIATRINPFVGPEYGQLRIRFQNALRDRLLRSLRLVDAYAAALADGSFQEELRQLVPSHDTSVAEVAVAHASVRLKQKVLADADIDALLALAHLFSLGYRGRADVNPITHWEEPYFYCKVFIDEVQDFSEIQVFLMAEQADPRRRAVTAVGDFKQQLNPGTVVDIRRCFPRAKPHELKPSFLSENKRQAPALAYFSSCFRREVLGDRESVVKYPTILEKGVSSPTIWKGNGEENDAALLKQIILMISADRSLAVVCSSKDIARELEGKLCSDLGVSYRQTQVSERRDLCRPYFIHFTTALDVKGLEFDAVIVPDFDRFDLTDPISANSAYVAITRPKSELHVIGDVCLRTGLFAQMVSRTFPLRDMI